MGKRLERVTVYLDDEEKAELERQCKLTKMSRNSLIISTLKLSDRVVADARATFRAKRG